MTDYNGNIGLDMFTAIETGDINQVILDFETWKYSGPHAIAEAITVASSEGQLEILKYLFGKHQEVEYKYNPGFLETNAFMNAIVYGDLAIVKYLVSIGADIHTEDDRALILAIHPGNLPIVKYLVENGVVSSGEDALYLAYQIGLDGEDRSIYDYLLQQGFVCNYIS